MQLNQLFPNLSLPQYLNKAISGLAQDSRQIKPGYAFLACQGQQIHGKQFIEVALQAGAVAIFLATDQSEPYLESTLKTMTGEIIPVIAVPQLEKQLGNLAAQFYGHPSHYLSLIGITGTNGKTSCSQFIATALQALAKPCGIIGTLGYGFPEHLAATTHTTPDAITVQRLLAELREQGAQAVSMEVSSHALEQVRVQASVFNTAVFTNLTRDHLDYHGDMAHYAAAKQKLFEQPHLKHAVINADDNFGLALLSSIRPDIQALAYTTQMTNPVLQTHTCVVASDIKFTGQGIQACVKTPWGVGMLNTKLMGRFNLSNLLAVITTLGIFGFTLEKILACVNQLQSVAGRMELLGGGSQPQTVIDYAHTPDALEQVLRALREHCSGKLWCVFGCGGDRDRGKRPIMGRIAEQYADVVIVTSDNPRHEDQKAIIADILSGISVPAEAIVIPDRARAIEHVLQCAKPNDVVLIAGKGHETYQQIGDEKLPFSDVMLVKRLLATNS